jgi:glycosyltransferase involved in cell wall biosynthesis
LENIVNWLGDLSPGQLAREYNQCHVFCLPSVQEGFGLVFLEAMASGKVIVASRAAAIPEVVKHGLLVEPDDECALENGLFEVFHRPELAAELADKAREYVKSFDSIVVAKQFALRLRLDVRG